MSFFFAKNGRKNPKAELVATLKAFINPGKIENYDQHPICRFPSRYLYFKDKLGLVKNTNCPKYDAFVKRTAAKSISLVFSSYYLNAPASAFGHTLLRLSKTPTGKKVPEGGELLDYAANYAAMVTTSNALLYGLAGLTGGFNGEFTAMPYFYKVREYNDYESRDLWEYQLNLDQKQINKVVAHIWEMGQTTFQYFYLTGNCAYHMMGLIDIANPTWRLTERTPFFVIPASTIRVAMETPGLVTKVLFRPSKKKQFFASLKKLNKSEYREFEKLTAHKNPNDLSAGLEKSSRARILDAGMDYLDFTYSKEILLDKSVANAWKRKFLIARAKTGIRTKKEKIPTKEVEMPHRGHGLRRLSLREGSGNQYNHFTQFEYRFALHDLMDATAGQSPYSTMEMGNAKFRLTDWEKKSRGNGLRAKFRLESFSLMRVRALNTITKRSKKWSWRAHFGTKTIKDRDCVSCFSPTAELGFGGSVAPGKWLFSLLLAPEFNANSELGHRGFRAGIGPELDVFYNFAENIKLKVFGEIKTWQFVKRDYSYRYGTDFRWGFKKNWALDIAYTRHHALWETSTGLLFYY
ncbi:MAG: DUF4105 domain-containing protein [Halobacteriovoraceae bacterium]|nr:DUF4105 domain-containing protein [Halobacteriovoraceae bacterium]